MTKKIIINDVTLRDGMHAISHQYSVGQIAQLTKVLDESGVDIIEATHGDGLGGSSIQYGFSKETEDDIIRTAVENSNNAKVGVLLVPGIGTIDHLKNANQLGAQTVRVATHCSEADVSKQHIQAGVKLGMDTVGFLMMSHRTSPENLLEEAKKMESYGAQTIYVVDSAGALTMEGVRRRIRLFKENLTSAKVGFHAHNNLSLGVANSIVAIEEGADRIDASLAGMGAGAGNASLEQLVAVMNKLDIQHSVDLYKTMDAADYLMKPMMKRPVQIDRLSLMLGYTGVYSSFLLFAERAGEEYGVDARDILVKLAEMNAVGGQEDWIIGVAQELAKQKV
ncbi:4-hydroxy-2-oxovalerate aldolase [Kurthia zopfii]|uniref:4-hydroxy-2-oxovalerate aldolase n=1 Tax=Kurthia zopfii TaxID=1650 RepID=A0A2U3ABD0_9BACL|nr:4-hydroxy-2-oxovalerate aldolase [Kurthia zopfii]PWI21846.1 4-hydroxy-2-oxovalerate aldolase [Kurthia zopfii]TDR36559.1 4-hydroxy-2-oxovalerate aldolase [Kurthia zopfii]STX09342.1 4-hydroxy-2-oxovalerate aldolase [Kurthia zopfii]VEI06288.1 4-hydroxy-2-oxovalerate aldolase [Kurthia zopfii]GEK32002.1 4-hydroxy-2-oxovalerate aldolase [Kurthia zopfii]